MTEKTILDPQVEELTSGFLQKAGLADLPEDMQAEYTEKIGLEIQRRIGIIAMDKLDDKAAKELEAVLKKNPNMTHKKLTKFFTDNIENFEEVLAKELDEFLKDYLEKIKAL